MFDAVDLSSDIPWTLTKTDNDEESNDVEQGTKPMVELTEDLLFRCRVERSLLWEITGSLAAAGNDLRVGKQLLFSKPKIVVKQTVFNRAYTKDPRPTSSIQR